MKKNANISKLLKSNPYRGIITEIAEELSISKQSVSSSIKRENLDTLRLVANKMRSRKIELESIKAEFNNYSKEAV